MDNFMLLIDDRERSINNMVEKFRSEMTKIFNEMPDKLDIYAEATSKEKEKDIKDFLKDKEISRYELSDDMLDDVMDAFLYSVEMRNWGNKYKKFINKGSSLRNLIDTVNSECRTYYSDIRMDFKDMLGEGVEIEKAKQFIKNRLGDNADKICEKLYETIDDEFREGVKDKQTMLDVYFFVILEEAFEYAEKHIWRDK